MLFFFSPLEQFEINILWLDTIHVYMNTLYLFLEIDDLYEFLYIFNNFSIYCCLVSFFLYFIFNQYNYQRNLYPKNNIDLYSEKLYLIMINIIIINFVNKFWGRKYLTFIFSLFFYILVLNIFGLLPLGFTNTSFPMKCLSISVSMMIGFTILGILIQGKKFIDHFIPSGIPIYLLPMLCIIEIISYISKAFSLSIRLFANMMSGHILLNIISKFFFKLNNLSIFIGIIPFIFIVIISCLEVGICILQAYVFIILISLYYNDTCKIDEKNLYPLGENIGWQMSLVTDRIFFRINILYYNSVILDNLQYIYERRFFLNEYTNINKESLINLSFITKIKKKFEIPLLYESPLLAFQLYLGADEYTYDNYYFNTTYNFIFFEYFYNVMMEYIFHLNCLCNERVMSWFGEIIYYSDYMLVSLVDLYDLHDLLGDLDHNNKDFLYV